MAPRWQLGLGRENGLLFWAMIAIEASFGSFFALWPIWIEELGASVSTVGLMLGLGGVLRLFALLSTTWLIHHFGAKRVIVAVRLVAIGAIGWAAVAQHWTWLFPCLLGMAIGEMIFPVVNNLVAQNAGEQRVRAFAIVLTTGPSLSLMVTPLLSGVLVELWGLRAPFVAAALFSAIGVVLFAQMAPTRPTKENEPTGSSYAGLLRVPGVPLLLTLQFLTFFGLGMGTSLLSIYLHEAKGYSEAIIPPLTAATAFGSILFSTGVTRSRRLTAHPMRAVALAAGSAALAYLMFLRAEFLPVALFALVLRGGFFAAWPLYAAVLGEATPERLRPHVFAMGEVLAGTGFVLAPVFAGQLYDVRPDLPLLAGVAILLPLIVVLAALRPPRPLETAEAASPSG